MLRCVSVFAALVASVSAASAGPVVMVYDGQFAGPMGSTEVINSPAGTPASFGSNEDDDIVLPTSYSAPGGTLQIPSLGGAAAIEVHTTDGKIFLQPAYQADSVSYQMGILVAELGETLLTSDPNAVVENAAPTTEPPSVTTPQAFASSVGNGQNTNGGNGGRTGDTGGPGGTTGGTGGTGGTSDTDEPDTTTDDTGAPEDETSEDNCLTDCETIRTPQAPDSNTAVVVVGDRDPVVVPVPASAGLLVGAFALLGGLASRRQKRAST